MITFYTIHPFFVHFVVGLFVVSVLLDLGGMWKKSERLHFAAWLNLMFAAVSVIPAVASGLWSKNNSIISQASRSTLETHETLAFLIAGLILLLFLWRVGQKGKIPIHYQKVYAGLSIAGLLLLLTVAYYGGKLVYIHGTGVKKISGAISRESEPSPPQKPRFLPHENFSPEK